MASSLGKMERDMKVTLSMIREKAKVNSTGKMAEYMMDSGRMANSTARVNLQQKRELREQESGIKAGRLSGFLESLLSP